MGKFKVGDKVRFVEKYSTAEVGDEGVVDGLWSDGIHVKVGEASYSCFDRRVELVPAWQPKVGDRVRLLRDGLSTIGAAGWIGTIRSVGNGPNPYQIELDKGGKHKSRAVTPDGYNWTYADGSDIEPLNVFTIEAGKFYKTRDGRKVGPMSVFDSESWQSDEDNDGRLWIESGERFFGCDRGGDTDLIAEWIDEPAAPASNDNAAPAKPKFKVGDRVRSISEDATRGKVGTLIRDDASEVPYLVRFDDFNEGHGAGDSEWWLNSNEVSAELVTTPATPTAIVALIEDGQPKPSSRPFVHATVESATTEAERLAGIHRGKQFGIYVLADTREADKPAYDHEWQNLAASGEKIQAIKALKSLTGMGLKPAKDAVEYFLAAA